MNKNLLIVSIILLLTLGVFFFFYKKASSPNDVFCIADAKVCPDGTSVGRVGPNCDFAPCPTTTTKVEIISLTPNQGTVGQEVTINGTGFIKEDDVIKFGIGYIYYPTQINENTLEFIVPDGHELCPPGQQYCPQAYPPVQPGLHEVQVINNNGISNTLQFEVL